MPDPVNLADVLEGEQAYCPTCRCWNYVDADDTPDMVRAVLAYGGGDPVVVMPDGTLMRGSPLTLFDWAQRQSVVLIDPVAPDA